MRRIGAFSIAEGPYITIPFFRYGAGDRVRTGDPNVGNVMLYQLSYSRPYPHQDSNLGQPA